MYRFDSPLGGEAVIVRLAYSFLFLWLSFLVSADSSAEAIDQITSTDLVNRWHIPLAAISPDGRFAAYVLVRGDAARDDYQIVIKVKELRGAADPLTVSEYRLAADETFNEAESFKASAADLHWGRAHSLIFIGMSVGKRQLMMWDSPQGSSRKLGSSHDRIVIDGDAAGNGRLALSTADFIDRRKEDADAIPDDSWRMRDGYRFLGPFRNPKTGRRLRSQKWILSLSPIESLNPQGEASDIYESTPVEWHGRYATSTVNDDSTITVSTRTLSPDGSMTAMVESGALDLSRPDDSYSSSRIVIESGNRQLPLTPFARPRKQQAVLGWAGNGRSFFYLDVGPTTSAVNQITLDKKIRSVYTDDGQLEVPGAFYDRTCQVFSSDSMSVLLVRSTNVTPAELVEVNLAHGSATVVDSPNTIFRERAKPEVRFYDIEAGAKDLYGRLYLPLGYQPGRRYPLVITQYYSRPGFYASTGDEVPILPMSAIGIAVFAMNSHGLAQVSNLKDFRTQISRVSRPLEGMEWIIRKLAAEGIVDPTRVGVMAPKLLCTRIGARESFGPLALQAVVGTRQWSISGASTLRHICNLPDSHSDTARWA
jgi:dipeptidyl aminopeptidase/acylaminoacyl peptidase